MRKSDFPYTNLSSPQLTTKSVESKESPPRSESPLRERGDDHFKKLMYPGEPIFPDNFYKDQQPKVSHQMLNEILSGAICKIKKGDLWRRLVAYKDHRYIYYSKDLHTPSQISSEDIICFMEKATTKEFGVIFLSYVVVREQPRTPSSDKSSGSLEKRHLFWIIHFIDSKLQILTELQKSSFETHKDKYLEGLIERYRCFDYQTHISTIWKAYGLEDDTLFDFKDTIEYDDETPRSARSDSIASESVSTDSSPRGSSPRSDSSPRVIFLGKKKKHKKQISYIPQDTSFDSRTESTGIVLNLPPDIITSLNNGRLSMTITFESKNVTVSTEKSEMESKHEFVKSNPEKKDVPVPKERRARSFSTPGLHETKSVEEKRKAWANSNKNK